MAGANKPGRRAKKPLYKNWSVPREFVALARDRTAYLFTPHLLSQLPLRDALANAYLQGVADAAEAGQSDE